MTRRAGESSPARLISSSGRGPARQTRLKRRTAFVPPNPNEFDIA